MLRYLFCLIGLVFPPLLHAQPGEVRTVRPGRYMMRHWTTRDGLPSDYSNQIFQSKDGYIWVATESGLARFDGRRFVVYDQDDLPGWSTSWVREIHQTGDGVLWIQSYSGELVKLSDDRFYADETIGDQRVLGVMSSGEGRVLMQTMEYFYEFKSFSEGEKSPFSGYARGGITDWLIEPNGRQWLATVNGLLYYDGRRVVRYGKADGLPGSVITGIERASDGTLWVSTNAGIGTWVDGRFQLVLAQDSINYNQMSPGTFIDGTGRVWIVSSDRLYRPVDAGYVPEHFGMETPPIVRTLYETRDGRLWTTAGSHEQGQLYFFEDDRWHPLDLDGDVKLVNDLMEDREGNVWLSTTAGVFCLSFRKALVYTEREGLPEDEIYPILEDRQGRIWMGSWGGGVFRLDGERLRVFTTTDGLPHNSIRAMALTRAGDIHVTSPGSYSKILNGRYVDPGSNRIFSEGGMIYSIYETANDGVLYGDATVMQIDGAAWKPFFDFGSDSHQESVPWSHMISCARNRCPIDASTWNGGATCSCCSPRPSITSSGTRTRAG